MPYHLPIVANFGRSHANQEQHKVSTRDEEKIYYGAFLEYYRRLVSGECLHYIRDSRGEPILQVNMRQE